jgi:DNA-binding CsgD family transcriptional regulator
MKNKLKHDLAGRTFGRWSVLSLASAGKSPRWMCRCECRTERTVKTTSLIDGLSKSCECLQRELFAKASAARKVPLVDRFFKFIDKNGPMPHDRSLGPCWIFTSNKNRKGYGTLFNEGTTKMAHRLSWEVHHGPIPPGMLVCHKCDNPPCVRPDHLFVGTVLDNAEDMIRKGRHSSRSHPERIARGERLPHAVLTAEMVRLIRLKKSQGESYNQIARDLKLNRGTIAAAGSRKNWKHVD